MKTTKFKRIQCIDRALDILAVIAADKPQTVNEIAGKAGLNTSTAYNIVKTLETRGFVAGGNGRYEIGHQLGLMASNWDIAACLPVLTKPILEEFSQKLGEAVCVTILRGMHAEIVNLIPGTRQVSAQFLHRDWKYPLNLGTGRLLIALGDPEEWQAHIERHLLDGPRNEGERNWDARQWHKHFEQLRHQDYVSLQIVPSDGEESIGAVAVPLRSPQGVVLAAIGSSCPQSRATHDHLLAVRKALLAAIAGNPLA